MNYFDQGQSIFSMGSRQERGERDGGGVWDRESERFQSHPPQLLDKKFKNPSYSSFTSPLLLNTLVIARKRLLQRVLRGSCYTRSLERVKALYGLPRAF